MPSSLAKRTAHCRNSRSGQGAIEYILLILIVVGVVVGVIYPLVQQRFDNIQNTMKERTARVISQANPDGQGPYGIPYEWFFGNGTPNFDEVGQKLADAQAAAAGRDGNNGRNNRGNKNPKNGSDGSDTGSDGGASGGGALGGTSSLSGSGPGAGAGSKGRGALASDDNPQSSDAEDKKSASRRGGGSSNSNFDGATEDEGRDTKLKGELSADNQKKGSDGGGIVGRIKAMARPDEAEASGCSNVNLFTVLKILALIVVLFLGGAIAVSSRRGKGN
jgi:hypothetical protein